MNKIDVTCRKMENDYMLFFVSHRTARLMIDKSIKGEWDYIYFQTNVNLTHLGPNYRVVAVGPMRLAVVKI